MEYALEERIGNPELFTGRKKELDFYLNWINDIKERKSQSMALLARRKMGKTALMERLFNITFHKNNGVIPFYYEIKESKIWIVDFCIDFCLNFVCQYMAFKTRKKEYLQPVRKLDFEFVKTLSKKEGFADITGLIENVQYLVQHEHVDNLWHSVREAPKTIAYRNGEYIVQMIDEFQFLNDKIYLDRQKSKDNLVTDLAGGYLSTAESKVAPLLVSGSWVGWLMNMLVMMLPGRFRYTYLENMPEKEAIEMVYNYSRFFDVPITDETAYLLIEVTEGSPFYISSIMRSICPGKDLRTIDGLSRVLEYETIDDRGVIKFTWMEYIASAFPQINDRNAKNIVLHLCKNRERELTRKEILEDLQLDMTDAELELRLKALVKADIIKQGRTNYDYRGVQDNIFDKVFRGVYEKEIHEFDVSIVKKEYNEKFKNLKKKYHTLLGKYNYRQGYYAEYALLDQLKYRAIKNNELLKSITRYLPGDFNFCEYSRVWRYDSSPEYEKNFSVDIFAKAKSPADYSLIGEVKSRDLKKFSKEEVEIFKTKLDAVKKLENIELAQGFIFSRSGFTKEAEDVCKAMGIACSEDERWVAVQGKPDEGEIIDR